ncbi:pyridoxamine 5'-phosphate oxidase family protein [Caulobacter sp. ErkDOM-YI]|uniref:2Fe-2S iron-sulfur cluster-binding protein n=1 Tax=unclassified Caulobacter TaxID=2648921 RepID=UPI003AF76081
MTHGDPTRWPHDRSPFHEGEQALQERLGVRAKIEATGRKIIRGQMPDQHRTFFEQLPFIVLGSRDATGQPWATLLDGAPGFVQSPSAATLTLAAAFSSGDPAAEGVAAGQPVGFLGIELHTRRRNRVNGRVSARGPEGFSVAVDQSFGNCPQYIQGRHFERVDQTLLGQHAPPKRTPGLSQEAALLVAQADTFFIASTHTDKAALDPVNGVDVSHRGGKPGFVRVQGDVLTIPDFLGNFLFNTLGNILVEPRVGLVFPDFSTGDLWHISAKAEIIWDGPEVAGFAGAERLLQFTVLETVKVAASLSIRAIGDVEASPYLDKTGSWEATEPGAWGKGEFRAFRVAWAEPETETVRSLVLKPMDGGSVPVHKAGQHIFVRLTVNGALELRPYTVSDAANGSSYRISVKRQGRFSEAVHQLNVGDVVELLPPRGEFVFDEAAPRPAVLLSAGIGVTPMIAMINRILVNNGRSRSQQRLWFFHGARNSLDHAFRHHMVDKCARHSNLTMVTAYNEPLPNDVLGRDHDITGWVDLALLKARLPFDDYEFYLCGPPPFMSALSQGLLGMGVRPERIHSETFGPAAIKPKAAETTVSATGRKAAPNAATEGGGPAVEVEFRASGKHATWRPGDGTLLELAEREGLSPLHSCRSGSCGVCAVKLLSGVVGYENSPTAHYEDGEALICSAAPKHDGGDVPGPLVLDV